MDVLQKAKEIAKLLKLIENSKERLDRFEKMAGKYVGLKIESQYTAHVHMDADHLFDYIRQQEMIKHQELTEQLKNALEK